MRSESAGGAASLVAPRAGHLLDPERQPMKKLTKKMSLRPEVIRQLRVPALAAVAGGGSVAIPYNCYASDVPWLCNTISSLCTVP